MSQRPTIFALASAPGRAGVAVFRISGPVALTALRVLGVQRELKPREAALVKLFSPATCHLSPVTPIDTALALYFPAPHSFTGEEVVELHTHGSRAITSMLLDALGTIDGVRMAEAGEFARRAFMNGKMDLVEAEGLADLIDAETASQHRQATRQMGGDTTLRLEALRSAILEPLALMEAYIDFPDEDIPEEVLSEAVAKIATLRRTLEEILDDGGIGEKIRTGLEVVILGPPNAGKSSLLNYLVKRDAAIVSPEAGTTRDLIEVALDVGGYAVTLVDTAGIRTTDAAIESEGIRRALHRAENADLTLHLCEITTIAESFSELKALDPENHLVIVTKSDLAPLPELPPGAIPISTQTGEGMAVLMDALKATIARRMESVSAPLITRARHRAALGEACAALTRFNAHAPLELCCEELRLAAAAIGKITGKIWVDDVLDLVFSRFCIGK
jgi:tRNA modification GTPase